MWRIQQWSKSEGRGLVQGPHLSFTFDTAAAEVDDFLPGEEVTVGLESEGGEWRVVRVEPMHARQPRGTALPAFAELNRLALWDFEVSRYADDCLLICGGNGLAYHHSVELRFRGVCWYSGGFYFHHAHLRRASEEERGSIPADGRDGAEVFAIVTEHGNGKDGAVFLLAAESVEVAVGTFRRRAEGPD